MGRTLLAWAGVWVLLVAVSGCGGGGGGADASIDAGPEPSPCDGYACGEHGECAVGPSGAVCVCEDGYGGARCEGCYAGYHDDGTGACVLDERCMPTSCSLAGTCDDTSGSVVCTCDEGSTGDHCEECATGHHRDASGCVADESCAVSDPCGDHGTCDDASGEIVCACEDGYAGETCGSCYAGYHDDGTGACVLDERCAATSCSAAGTCDDTSGAVVCTCDAGFEGAHCESCASGYHRDSSGGCALDASCAVDSCVNGTCDDTGGVVTCICAMGYAGPSCAMCASGYRDDGTGTCVLVQVCDPTACTGHGACDDTGGVVTCACDAGYSGARCASCASGYHRAADDTCVPDASCASGSPCGAHGTCVDAGGVVSCTCDAGYAGATCASCYPGYHSDGAGGCVLNETCLPGYCDVNGTCDDSTGAAICTCDPGFLRCGASCVTGAGARDQFYVASSSCGTASFCYGQSFTAGITGLLTRIRHSGVSAGTQTLTIYAGDTSGCTPGGTVLYTQTVDSSAAGAKDIVLTTPLSVTAGMIYTFKIEGAAGWSHPCDTLNGYTAGRFLAASGWDIGFETYVATCP